MAVFVFTIGVSRDMCQWLGDGLRRKGRASIAKHAPGGIVNRINKLVKLFAFRLEEKTRLLIAPREVDVDHRENGLKLQRRGVVFRGGFSAAGVFFFLLLLSFFSRELGWR